MKCKQCNEEVDISKLGKYASGEFCTVKCAKIYAAKSINHKELKDGICSICKKPMRIKKCSGITNIKCDECKNKIKNTCRYCGQLKPCKRPDVCKIYRLFPTLIKYFGFDKTKIGTINVYKEFDRIKNMLIEDY